MSKPINVLVDELPENNLTVKMLNLLDYILPNEWTNIVGFDNMIKNIVKTEDPDIISKVRARALELYNNKDEGYQTAIWLYETVDTADKAVGAAALMSKASEKINFLSFLNKITPKADTTQSIDFLMKFIVEIVAYTKINGVPGNGIEEFVTALKTYYRGEALIRMVAFICVDGIVALGPDFIIKVGDKMDKLKDLDIMNNPLFKQISQFIPGSNSTEQLGFISNAFTAAKTWITTFVESKGITYDSIKDNLGAVIEFSDDKLDYVAASIDMLTNYYRHTGIQTVASRLIERAHEEI